MTAIFDSAGGQWQTYAMTERKAPLRRVSPATIERVQQQLDELRQRSSRAVDDQHDELRRRR